MRFLQGVAAAYGLTVMAAASWFEWVYARDNGFTAWLAFGAVVPVLKALVWPVLVLMG